MIGKRKSHRMSADNAVLDIRPAANGTPDIAAIHS
jgi:hypothetical protein